ncbi:MAG: precorrin-2 C(20)-methyltransferase [Rhodomicrobium sp.]
MGPGDPDLITVKAAKILGRVRIIAHFRKRGSPGHAWTIARPHLKPGVQELPLEYPVTTEVAFTETGYIDAISRFYSTASESIRQLLEEGQDVALLSEGDPFFYGSFLHMYERLRGTVPIAVVPGVTGMSGCWTAAAAPIALGDDVLTVLPGTLGQEALIEKLRSTDAAAIMKVGYNLPKIREALCAAGRLGEAIYVERGTMAGERIALLSEIGEAAPYFSIVLVPGCKGRRIL